MPGRKYEAQSGYRYGFNGKEKDKTIVAESLDFGARIYDGRIGRWYSLDPLQAKYPNESHYAFVSNNPLFYADKDGRDKIITITIVNNDGTTTQIRKIDKSWFNYYKEARYDGAGFYYYKESQQINLIIDNREGNNISVDEAMKDPNKFKVSSENIERTEISAGDYWSNFFFSLVSSSGDESDKIRYGYHIYGNGKDMSWQSMLPVAADGSESLNLETFFKFLGAIRPSAQPVDIVLNTNGSEKIKQILTVADEIRKAVVRAAAAIEIANKDNPNNSSPRIEPGSTNSNDTIPWTKKSKDNCGPCERSNVDSSHINQVARKINKARTEKKQSQ